MCHRTTASATTYAVTIQWETLDTAGGGQLLRKSAIVGFGVDPDVGMVACKAERGNGALHGAHDVIKGVGARASPNFCACGPQAEARWRRALCQPPARGRDERLRGPNFCLAPRKGEVGVVGGRQR